VPNLVELVLRDHAKERELLRRVRRVAVQGVPNDRAFGDLVRLLVAHEAAESLVFFPTVKRFVPGAERVTYQLLAERRRVEVLVAELQRLTVSDSQYLEALDALAAFRLAHARDVEVRLVPPLRTARPGMVMHRLGARYLAVRAVAHTLTIGGRPFDFAATPVRDAFDAVHRGAHLALARSTWSTGETPLTGSGEPRSTRGPAGAAANERPIESQPSLP
jgi:hypothetical protein